MAKKARKDEIAAAAPSNPATRKRKRKRAQATSAAEGMCEDIIRNIFARLPARTLVASMALSKHHRSMIFCPEFVNLHCRLGPPLPHSQIAYIATAEITNKSGSHIVSGFHRFHVAEPGRLGYDAPMRSLTGTRYINKKYVNCNGILLLAGSGRCALWNPCVANSEKLVTIPNSASDDRVLGWGYGKKSQTYKLLLLRWCKGVSRHHMYPKDLLVYSLGDAGEEQQQLRTVLSGENDGEEFFHEPLQSSSRQILISSLYIDGTIYLFHVEKRVVFAFDVDDETLTTINLPDNHYILHQFLEIPRLMEMFGRPCLELEAGWYGCRTLWVLTVDHQWEPKCVLEDDEDSNRSLQKEFREHSIAGVWDCGGVL